MERCSGVLMPIFSLPSKYGIGDFGKESYEFVDNLSKSSQKIWQILPLVQTGYGNSPYSSICSYSFNPYFISPELLKEQGLITEQELQFSISNKKYIDYAELYAVRYPLLKKAFERFDKKDLEFQNYLESKQSYDYALYMSIKEASGQKHFYEWEDNFKNRDKNALLSFEKAYKEQVLFWQFVQFIARKQWFDLKKYANEKGVLIMGDMPLYVALDSVDVWTNKHLYKLDDNFMPIKKAGVPPDYFCEEGQLWGNPVYDYEVHEKDNFSWWINRIKSSLEVFDYVRIDHFRGFDRYYQVDSDRTDAKVGEWIKVPSEQFFNELHKHIDKDKIIAEDLGIIDDGVRDLLKFTGYPGMKILSFAFNGDKGNLYLPEKYEENCICYTGTHDNDTLLGLINKMNDWDYNNLVQGVKNSLELFELEAFVDDTKGLLSAIIELGVKSKANLFIIPMQDILALDSDYRINEPGTVKDQNWSIKFNKEQVSTLCFLQLKELCDKYSR
ncbi:MAG: 4-alpha-glucanotransferase [Clostridiales bacterium]|nr:4-alpha-glucanotransferase [Clostridiales bacterium]